MQEPVIVFCKDRSAAWLICRLLRWRQVYTLSLPYDTPLESLAAYSPKGIIISAKLDEPGADLPVALALASSYRDAPIADDLVAIGEVGLTGEIRSVSHMNQRLGEVSRLGFTKCIIPRGGSEKLDIPNGLTVYRVRNLREAIETAL